MGKSGILIIIILIMILDKPNQCLSDSSIDTDWNKDGAIIGGGFALRLFATKMVPSPDPLSVKEIGKLSTNDINWFDRSATGKFSPGASRISDILVGISIASPLFLLFSKEIRDDFDKVGVLYLETFLLSNALNGLVKKSTARIRPYVYNPDAPLEEKLKGSFARRSFYSGHTAFAFANSFFTANIYNIYHSNSNNNRLNYGLAALASSLTGYMRYRSGAHFPTDIITGAVAGSLVGFLIPHSHKEKKQSKSEEKEVFFSIQFIF